MVLYSYIQLGIDILPFSLASRIAFTNSYEYYPVDSKDRHPNSKQHTSSITEIISQTANREETHNLTLTHSTQ